MSLRLHAADQPQLNAGTIGGIPPPLPACRHSPSGPYLVVKFLLQLNCNGMSKIAVYTLTEHAGRFKR